MSQSTNAREHRVVIHTQASRGAFRVPIASKVLDGEELGRTTSRYRSTIHRTRAGSSVDQGRAPGRRSCGPCIAPLTHRP